MESIASKLKTRRESLNISVEQISQNTCISLHHLKSLENGCYSDLPGGMYNRAILRSYCDELDLDKNEILRCYDDEIGPHQEKPATIHTISSFSKIKAHTVAAWCLIFIFGIGLFFGRGWIVSALSPYFSSDYDKSSGDLLTDLSPVQSKTVNANTLVEMVNTHTEIPLSDFPGDNADNDAAEALSQQTDQPMFTMDNASLKPLRLEIAGKEECWFSIDSDGFGAVTKTLAPGDVEFFTATRTILLTVGNAGGVSIRINDHTVKTLGQSGQVVHLTIDKDTLQNFIDPSAS